MFDNLLKTSFLSSLAFVLSFNVQAHEALNVDQKNIFEKYTKDTSTHLEESFNSSNSSPRVMLTKGETAKTSPQEELADFTILDPTLFQNYFLKKSEGKIDLTKPIKVLIPLDHFQLTHFQKLATILEDMAEKPKGLETILLKNGTSTKFNRIFNTLNKLFSANKVRNIIYSAASEAVYAGAAEQGFQTLANSPGAKSKRLPMSAYNGKNEWKVYKIPAQFHEDTIKSTIWEENTLFIEKWDEFYKSHSNLKKPKDLYYGINDFQTYANLRFDDKPLKHFKQIIKEHLTLPADYPGKKLKALSFFNTTIDSEQVTKILGLLTDNESLFDQLICIDFAITNIDWDCTETIIKLLKRENLKFINLYDTEFLEPLVGEKIFLNRIINKVDMDPSLVSKIIWCAVDKQVLESEAKKLPEDFRKSMIDTHYQYGLLRDWLDHIERINISKKELKTDLKL